MSVQIELVDEAITRACDGVMLVLAEQPLVGSETLSRLITAWRRQPRQIVASPHS